ncbi:MAG: hypothetical protein Q9226_009463 [Calogaya cf. arnoldii]
MNFQPESAATLMEKDATTVRASYRELSVQYESLVDDLEFANKRASRFQRRNQDLQSAVDSADKKTVALSESLAKLEAELEKARSTTAALQSALWQEHALGKFGFKTLAREEASEKNESERILYESILKGLQPFLVGKDLFFQDGEVTQSGSDQSASTSSQKQVPTPTQNLAALYQPRVNKPRGVTENNPHSWGPLPRHWMTVDQQESFAERLAILDAPTSPSASSRPG